MIRIGIGPDPTLTPPLSLVTLPVLAFVSSALLVLACGGRRSEPAADLIFTGGAVVTLDPTRPEAEGIAVRDGRIIAVGRDAEIRGLAGPTTRTVDLQGAMVVPGLIDAHAHIRSLGRRIASLDLRGVASIEEVARRVADRAAELPPGEWVTGGGWDQNLWPGEQFPDHTALTAASPDRPVWLSRIDGHAGWANMKAMQAAGVTRETPVPPGGVIERDGNGEPTGVFIDNATELVSRVEPQPTPERIKTWILGALARCAGAGLTEIHDAGVSEEDVTAFRELADEGRLPLRVYLMWSGMEGENLEELLRDPPMVDYRDRLTLRAIKLMVDGAMGSRGAVFFEDYSDDPGNRGLLVMSPESIEAATRLGLERGYQVCTHAIGDRGIRLTLDAYEKALASVPTADPRLRIEHLQCTTPEDIARMKRLEVIASMQPSHATSDMNWAEERVGLERGRGLYAWRWVLDQGVVLAAGSDFPVDPERPLIGIHAAVTRQDLEDRPEGGWHIEQAMTLEEALRAYTSGAAYAAFEENKKGKIAPGFWADLTVFSKDLRTLPSERLTEAGIAYTVVGGEIVFEAS